MGRNQAVRTSAASPRLVVDSPRERPTHAPDEGELIARAASDPAAFAELYQRHYAAVAAHIWRRTGDHHATEDLVAGVFHTALRRIRRYRSRGVPYRFYLLRIATNDVNKWMRSARRRDAALARLAECERPDDASVSASDASVEHLRQALGALAPRFQSVLALHYVDGLSVAETATVLGCREGTVKSRLSRARAALLRRMPASTKES